MKTLFPGFYSPSESDLATLWGKGIFVLDASVLLKLYEVPEQTRIETFAAFRKLGNRLWVPHQAAMEFQRNRARTIGMARNRVAEALDPLAASFHSFLKAAEALKLGERGHPDAVSRLVDIKKGGEDVIAAAKAAIANHVDLSGADPIREELDALLDGSVGSAPTTEQISSWNRDAEVRYGHRMGPGHLDQDKSKHPTYMLDNLVFDKRYGDVYLWMQTIDHAAAPHIRDVVMITNDRKGDWWKVTEHGIAGPLPELCTEIRTKADIDRFWMYDLETFLREAGVRLDVSVSNTTLSDVAIPGDEWVEFVEAAKNSRLLRKIDPTARYSLFDKQDEALHHARSQRARTRLKDTLVANGFQVMDASESIAIGYQIGEDNKAIIGAAMPEGELYTRSAAAAFREEVSTMSTLTEARRTEVFVIAPTILTAINDVKVFNWIAEQVEAMGASNSVFDIYYGADGHHKLISSIET